MRSHIFACLYFTWSFLMSRGVRVLRSSSHCLERLAQLEFTFALLLLDSACRLGFEITSCLAVSITFTLFWLVSAPSSLSTFSFALAARCFGTPTISLVIPSTGCCHLVCRRRDMLEQPIRLLVWLLVTGRVRLGSVLALLCLLRQFGNCGRKFHFFNWTKFLYLLAANCIREERVNLFVPSSCPFSKFLI